MFKKIKKPFTINTFFISLLLMLTLFSQNSFLFSSPNMMPDDMMSKRTIVMLCPAGDAGDTGRKLKKGYERGQAFKCVEQLQQKLSDYYNIDAIISRKLGQKISYLQTANFANRFHVDFFLQVHLYKKESAKPKIHLYHHVFNPLTDFSHKNFLPTDFIPLNLAHTLNIHSSKRIGEKMKQSLESEENKKKFDFDGVHTIPLTPLIGITAPALLIEIGINRDDKWHSLINAIVESLYFIGSH